MHGPRPSHGRGLVSIMTDSCGWRRASSAPRSRATVLRSKSTTPFWTRATTGGSPCRRAWAQAASDSEAAETAARPRRPPSGSAGPARCRRRGTTRPRRPRRSSRARSRSAAASRSGAGRRCSASGASIIAQSGIRAAACARRHASRSVASSAASVILSTPQGTHQRDRPRSGRSPLASRP